MLCPHIINITKKPKRGVIKIKLDKRNFEKVYWYVKLGNYLPVISVFEPEKLLQNLSYVLS